ncbi:hypothetical protein ABLE92_21175 [Gordonia sp. VNQ95]|jgi:hypothetical protein|uniref:hypothetical protein n=1 Tax=Gordonia TaxID=2053 RepID=UPI0032B418C1
MSTTPLRPETERPEHLSGTQRGPRRHRRITAGMIAILTVLTLGIGVTMGEGQARAADYSDLSALVDWLDDDYDSTNPLGQVVADALSDGGAELLEQWRLEMCASGGDPNGGADCTQSSTDMGGLGIAIVSPTSIELVPVAVYDPVKGLVDSAGGVLTALNGFLEWLNSDLRLPTSLPTPPAADGSATVIGNGFQFAFASGGGKATAISYLPLSLATAGASGGRSAYAFALVGIANAWTTDEIPLTLLGVNTGLKIPAIQSVGCYGGLTAAYAENVGACANVLGTFDFKLDQLQSIPQVQFALTDPSSVLFDTTNVLGEVITDIFAGQTPSLSQDFIRLSLGGDSLLALTSDYGLSAPVTVNWLGSTITIFPTTTINGSVRPNGLALPTIALGDLDTDQIIPIISIPQSTFPFGLQPLGPYTTGSTSASSLVSTRALTSTSTTPSAGLLRSAAISETDDDDTESDSATTTTTSPSTTSSSATATSGSTASSSSSSSSSSKTSTSTSRSTAATPSTGSTDDTDQSDDSDDDDTSSSNGSTPTVTGAN